MSHEDRATKALSAAIDGLMEYFDSVQLFVTKTKDDDMTIGSTAGKGNLFARVGQVGLWLSKVQSDLLDGVEPQEPTSETPNDDDDEDGTGA